MNTIKKIYQKYKEIILYLFFGGLTTIVNVAVYALMEITFGISPTLSAAAAWIISVLFAYITNKLWVFESKDSSLSLLMKEIGLFIGCRAFSGVLDIAIIWLFVERLGYHGLLIKILSNIVVVILNYFFSKLLIFRKHSQAK